MFGWVQEMLARQENVKIKSRIFSKIWGIFAQSINTVNTLVYIYMLGESLCKVSLRLNEKQWEKLNEQENGEVECGKFLKMLVV